MLIDTHAHIHFDEYDDDITQVLTRATEQGVTNIITVGTDLKDSKRAINFAIEHSNESIQIYATVGIHPHNSAELDNVKEEIERLVNDNKQVVVAIGECGLDYYRNHASAIDQEKVFRMQIELAQTLDLPLVFHVRDAWDDFFKIVGDYTEIRGVIHSFTGGPDELDRGMQLDLYFALNGIITFSKLESQTQGAIKIPADRLLLETDCPYLTPTPMRGKRNEPSYLVHNAKFIARHRGVNFDKLASDSTANARKLFNL